MVPFRKITVAFTAKVYFLSSIYLRCVVSVLLSLLHYFTTVISYLFQVMDGPVRKIIFGLGL